MLELSATDSRPGLMRWLMACTCALLAMLFLLLGGYLLFRIIELGLVVANDRHAIAYTPFNLAAGVGFALMTFGLIRPRFRVVQIGLAVLVLGSLFHGCIFLIDHWRF